MLMPKLPRSFYSRPATVVARQLIGKVLVRRNCGRELRARIVETEAYVGEHDLACHASKGRTKRTDVLYGPAGHAYVYFIYGMYDMFNVVTGREGDAQAVLIRGALPLDGWNADLTGPGKLTRAMKMTRALNRADLLGSEVFILDDAAYRVRIARSRRIGIDYAGPWRDALLRFVDAKVVSPRARASGKHR